MESNELLLPSIDILKQEKADLQSLKQEILLWISDKKEKIWKSRDIPPVLTRKYGERVEYDGKENYIVWTGLKPKLVGVVDKEWNIIIALKYDKISRVDDVYYVTNKQKQTSLFNAQWQPLFTTKTIKWVPQPDFYDVIEKNRDGNYLVTNKIIDQKKVSLFTKEGEPIFFTKSAKWTITVDFYDKIEKDQDGYRITKGLSATPLVALFDSTGKEKIWFHENITKDEYGNYQIEDGLKFGLLDASGKVLVPTEYDELFIDEIGNYQTEKWFSKPTYYKIFDRFGKELLPSDQQYLDLYIDGKNYVVTNKSNKVWVFSSDGEVITPFSD